jgi:hypothetical protein
MNWDIMQDSRLPTKYDHKGPKSTHREGNILKVGKTGTVRDANQESIPKELTKQLARGNGVLLLVPPTDLSTLADALATECDYPEDKTDRSLPAVARYY